MKNVEIKELTVQELTERLSSETELLQKLRFAHTVAPIENPTKIRAARRLIARLQTELRQRQFDQIREKCTEAITGKDPKEMGKADFLEIVKVAEGEANVKVTKKFVAQLAQEMKVSAFGNRK